MISHHLYHNEPEILTETIITSTILVHSSSKRSSNGAAFSTYCFHNGSSFSILYLKILFDISDSGISDDVVLDSSSCVDIENLGKVDDSNGLGQ